MLFCKYRDVFGKPNQGIHAYRFMNIAVVDMLGTVAISLLIAYYYRVSAWIVLGCAFLLGVLAHWLFCVNTTLNKMIFGKL
jgi:hypothetical protein